MSALPLSATLHPAAQPALAGALLPARSRTVVLGIGNILLSDEALGIKAIERFEQAWCVPPGVLVVDGGTSAMELLDIVAGCGLLLVVDAVLAGGAPGTAVRLAGADVPVFFRSKLSPHQIGLSDLLASLEFCGQLPARTVILGLEPEHMRLGLELTPAVQAALPRLVGMIADELRMAGFALVARERAA